MLAWNGHLRCCQQRLSELQQAEDVNDAVFPVVSYSQPSTVPRQFHGVQFYRRVTFPSFMRLWKQNAALHSIGRRSTTHSAVDGLETA